MGKSNGTNGGRALFVECIFIFHQLRVGAKNTTFPFSFFCTYRKHFTKVSPSRTQLTRQSSSADMNVFFVPPPTHYVEQRNPFFSPFPRRETFYCYPCVQSTQIRMTLTLNGNEVAINYIKYDALLLFSVQRSPSEFI